MTKRLTFSVDEAAEMLGIRRSGLYNAIERGEIPCLRIGKRILITRQTLEGMLGKIDQDSPANEPVDRTREP